MPQPSPQPDESPDPFADFGNATEFIEYPASPELRVAVTPPDQVLDPLVSGLELFKAHASWLREAVMGSGSLHEAKRTFGDLVSDVFKAEIPGAQKYNVSIEAAARAQQGCTDLLVCIRDSEGGGLVLPRFQQSNDESESGTMTYHALPRGCFAGMIVTVADVDDEPSILSILPLLDRNCFDVEAMRLSTGDLSGALGTLVSDAAAGLLGSDGLELKLLSSNFRKPEFKPGPKFKRGDNPELFEEAFERWESEISAPRRAEFLLQAQDGSKGLIFAGQHSHRVGFGINLRIGFPNSNHPLEAPDNAADSESLRAAFIEKYSARSKKVIELTVPQEAELREAITPAMKARFKTSWRPDWQISIEAASISSFHGLCSVLVGIQDRDSNYVIPDLQSKAFAVEPLFAGFVLIVSMKQPGTFEFELPEKAQQRIGYNSTIVPWSLVECQLQLLRTDPHQSIFFEGIRQAIESSLPKTDKKRRAPEIKSIEINTKSFDLPTGTEDAAFLLCEHEFGHTLLSMGRTTEDGVLDWSITPRVVCSLPLGSGGK